MPATGDRSKEKLPSLGPSALASGHVCLPAFVQGRAEHHPLGSPFLLGSQSHSSNWGIVSLVQAPGLVGRAEWGV